MAGGETGEPSVADLPIRASPPAPAPAAAEGAQAVEGAQDAEEAQEAEHAQDAEDTPLVPLWDQACTSLRDAKSKHVSLP
jgi:hypothetical protein